MSTHPGQLAAADQQRATAATSAAVLVEIQRLWRAANNVGYSPLLAGVAVTMSESDVRELLSAAVDLAACGGVS
jgi:hypothetical protein